MNVNLTSYAVSVRDAGWLILIGFLAKVVRWGLD